MRLFIMFLLFANAALIVTGVWLIWCGKSLVHLAAGVVIIITQAMCLVLNTRSLGVTP